MTPQPSEQTPVRPAWQRWLLFGVGWVAVGLGLLGAFLPVLPTTPFMLVALWAFSASSMRFHRWLLGHAVLGPPLRAWQRERVIGRVPKAIALTSMTASFAYVSIGVRPAWWALGLMGGVMLAGAIFILRVPSRPHRPRQPPPRAWR